MKTNLCEYCEKAEAVREARCQYTGDTGRACAPCAENVEGFEESPGDLRAMGFQAEALSEARGW